MQSRNGYSRRIATILAKRCRHDRYLPGRRFGYNPAAGLPIAQSEKNVPLQSSWATCSSMHHVQSAGAKLTSGIYLGINQLIWRNSDVIWRLDGTMYTLIYISPNYEAAACDGKGEATPSKVASPYDAGSFLFLWRTVFSPEKDPIQPCSQ